MILPERSRNILSIQSHVVHGYVGNKASTFPLQVLNWDVDVVNTVHFSNHTGYGKVFGTDATHEEISELFRGLQIVGTKYDALLTGYTPDSKTLKAVGEIGDALKKQNEECLWLLDPVMGDEGKLYVDESVVPIYREILSTEKVDIITPNQFEAELLLDFPITSIETLKQAIETLHSKFNLDHIVITSLSKDFVDSLNLKDNQDFIYTVISSKEISNDITLFKVPRLKSYFTGVGDLFSALLIDRVAKGKKLVESVDEVLTVMSKVLKTTQLLTLQKLGHSVDGSIGDPKTMKECELRIIESRDFYDSNEQKFALFKLDEL